MRPLDAATVDTDAAEAGSAAAGGAPDLPDGVPRLGTLYAYLTEGCNLACRHCWLAPSHDPQGAKKAVLAPALFETALAEALPLGLGAVKLTGGEPLLHPELLRLVGAARAHDLRVTIETNGVLLTPALAGELAALGVGFVAVSIDAADAALHDEIRGVRGAHEKAVAAVRALVAAGLDSEIIMSVMRANVHEVEAVARLGDELGVGCIKYNVVQPTARGEALHESGEALAVAELIALGHVVERDLDAQVAPRLVFDYPLAFRSLKRLSAGENGGRCGILGIMGLLATGRYAVCGIGTQVPELVFGRIGEDELRHIWLEHPFLLELRAGLPSRLPGVCADCLMLEQCLGSCIAQTYYTNGTLWAPYWFCDAASREGLFPESRRRTSRSPAR